MTHADAVLIGVGIAAAFVITAALVGLRADRRKT